MTACLRSSAIIVPMRTLSHALEIVVAPEKIRRFFSPRRRLENRMAIAIHGAFGRPSFPLTDLVTKNFRNGRRFHLSIEAAHANMMRFITPTYTPKANEYLVSGQFLLRGHPLASSPDGILCRSDRPLRPGSSSSACRRRPHRHERQQSFRREPERDGSQHQ